jgi:hypothetical protein
MPFLTMELYLRTGGNSCILAGIMPAFTPHEFVSKWKRAEAREQQSVQEHFIDLDKTWLSTGSDVLLERVVK